MYYAAVLCVLCVYLLRAHMYLAIVEVCLQPFALNLFWAPVSYLKNVQRCSQSKPFSDYSANLPSR